MRVNENGQYVSDDGFWVWDGAAWIPADGSATPAAASTATAESTVVADPVAGAASYETSAYQPEATQLIEAVDFASDTTAHDTPVTADESGTLASGDRVVPQVDNAHPMSPDGRHWWDGEQWIDVSTDATSLHAAGLAEDSPAASSAEAGWQGTGHEDPESQGVTAETFVEPEPEPAAEPVIAAQPERQLSPDGMWEWNGTQWVPAEQQQAAPEPEPVKVERQLSPDGHWEWDGSAWVPAQQEAVAPVPAGAHVSPDGHWWWDGSQWLPTGR
ncbi:MAG: hypothetical protein QOI76_3589 [Frankiales bacterium]|nr:hypothetical protein [Frankiales bacterium]